MWEYMLAVLIGIVVGVLMMTLLAVCAAASWSDDPGEEGSWR
jgi:hypothetical protein